MGCLQLLLYPALFLFVAPLTAMPFLPLDIFLVYFLLWLLAKEKIAERRWLATLLLSALIVGPSYWFIFAVSRKQGIAILLLQLIAVGLAIVARQLRFITSATVRFSSLPHKLLFPLIFIAACVPFFWHIISSGDILIRYGSDLGATGIAEQKGWLLFVYVLFLIFIILPKPAKWEQP